MVSILNTEFFRLKKSKLFWALLGVTAGMPLVSALLNVALFALADSSSLGVEMSMWEMLRSPQMNMFGQGLSSLTALTGDGFFALLCTSIFLSKEFSGGTFRNMLLANKSRRELYLSYLTVAVIIGAIYLGASFVGMFVFFSLFFGFAGMSAIKVITACLIALAMGLVSTIFVQTMVCMFMFGTRKMAATIVCPLVISLIVPSFISSFLDAFVMFGLLSEANLSWIPLHNTTMLSVTNVDGALVGKILMYNVPLSVFFAFMGWVSFSKADLK